VFDQIPEQGVREALFVGPLRVAENAVERARISSLDFVKSILQCRSDVFGFPADIRPAASFGNLKAVIFGKRRVIPIARGFFQRRGEFAFEHIADALKKEKWKDIRFKVGGVDRSAQDIGRFPQVGFKL
jgi:hypothetical protein